jgi:hypothetical protein
MFVLYYHTLVSALSGFQAQVVEVGQLVTAKWEGRRIGQRYT